LLNAAAHRHGVAAAHAGRAEAVSDLPEAHGKSPALG
jgi:hypothetical protein